MSDREIPTNSSDLSYYLRTEIDAHTGITIPRIFQAEDNPLFHAALETIAKDYARAYGDREFGGPEPTTALELESHADSPRFQKLRNVLRQAPAVRRETTP